MKKHPDPIKALAEIDAIIETMRGHLKRLQPERNEGSIWLMIRIDDRPQSYEPGLRTYQWVSWSARKSRAHKDLFYVATRIPHPTKLKRVRTNDELLKVVIILNKLIENRRRISKSLSFLSREIFRFSDEFSIEREALR